MDGRGRRGQGRRPGRREREETGERRNGRGCVREWRAGIREEDRRKPGARLGFAMTNGRRGHSPRAVRIDPRERLLRWTLRGESASLARVTSSVLGEDPASSSSSFFRAPPSPSLRLSRSRATPCIFLLFVRFIARSLSSVSLFRAFFFISSLTLSLSLFLGFQCA